MKEKDELYESMKDGSYILASMFCGVFAVLFYLILVDVVKTSKMVAFVSIMVLYIINVEYIFFKYLPKDKGAAKLILHKFRSFLVAPISTGVLSLAGIVIFGAYAVIKSIPSYVFYVILGVVVALVFYFGINIIIAKLVRR